MGKRASLFSLSIILIIITSGMTILLAIPDDILPINLSQNVSGSFSGGNGTSSNPYQISNISQLQNIRGNLTAHYLLTNDIDANSTKYWHNGSGFTPIGNESMYGGFKGSLNGQNHTIFNLFINRSTDYNGLFGYVDSAAELHNIVLENCNITGNNQVGGLIGSNGGIIENCMISGSVLGRNEVGGLIGSNGHFYFRSNITNCSASVRVVGDVEVGGLVGVNLKYGNLKDSWEDGLITGKTMVGGLLGKNDRGDVNYCSSEGKVIGNHFVGGLIGYSEFQMMGNNHATGDVLGESRVGGLIGYSGWHIYQSYATGNVVGGENIGGLIGHQARMGVNQCYSKGSVVGDDKVGGLIGYNRGDVINCSSSGKVTGNISAGGLVGWHGNNDVILRCWAIGDLNGSNYVGGLVGRNSGFVSHCFATGNISKGNNTGGLIGENDGGSVSKCFSKGVMNGTISVGGLVGRNQYGNISNCYSTGSVNGSHNIGGLVGENGGLVSTCYSSGYVNGRYYPGGLIGKNNYGEVSQSFWDNITSNKTWSGGGIGKNSIQMKFKSTFTLAGWNFSTIWDIINGYSYPFLRLFNYNESLKIITADVDIAFEDKLYSVKYFANSTLPGDIGVIWSIDTNASIWLTMNENGLLSGIPLNTDVGTYWINVSVSFYDEFHSFSNFTLSVINSNDAPIIVTIPIQYTMEDQNYLLNFSANDEDPTMDILSWTLITNASFLDIDLKTGILYGFPIDSDVGSFWVNVTVFDGNGGFDWTNFTLIVQNINDRPSCNITNLTLTIQEDSKGTTIPLNEIFFDIDNGSLVFGYKEVNSIMVSVEENTVTIVPKKNWCGIEVFQLFASDHLLSISLNVTVIVVPVNDAPFGVMIIAESNYTENCDQIINGTGYDVDTPYGDKLTFSWSSNISGEIGEGRSMNLSLPVGVHLITLSVIDDSGSSTSTSKVIEILPEEKIEKPKENEKESSPFSFIILILISIISLTVFILLIRRMKNYIQYEE